MKVNKYYSVYQEIKKVKELYRFFEPLSLLNHQTCQNIETLKLLMSVLQWCYLRCRGNTPRNNLLETECVHTVFVSVSMYVCIGILNISNSMTIFNAFLFYWDFKILVERKNGKKGFGINQNIIASFSFVCIC